MKIAQLPQRQRRQNIIIAILAIGLPILLFAAYQAVQLVSRASGDVAPKNVVISNVTTTMIVVSWTTDTKTYGSIIPLENEIEKSEIRDSRGHDRRYTHYVELENLEPNTKYNFKIKSNNTKYTSSEGKNLSFSTMPISVETGFYFPIHGAMETVANDDVLIYALASDGSTFPVSAYLNEDKTWVTTLGTLLKISDKSRPNVTDNTGLTLLSTTGNGSGAILTDTYSNLFDSSGKLKDTSQLTPNQDIEIYSKIPVEAKLTVSDTTVVPEEPVVEQPTPSRPVTPSSPVTPSRPVVTPTEPEEEEFTNREYRIIHQLQWQELVEESRVSTNVGPSSVRVTNLTDVGFTILWVSGTKESGFARYGVSSNDLSNTAYDQRDGMAAKGTYYVHSVKLERLQPATKYYYEIVSGEDTYNNNERKYSVTTLETVENAPPYVSVGGSLTNMPEHGEVVVIGSIRDGDEVGSSGTSYEVSSLSDESGYWTISIGDMRVANSNTYFEYTAGDKLIIEPLTTFKASTKEESMEGINTKDIKITLDPVSTESSTPTVSQLSSYGITNDPRAIVITGTSETPRTGIMDSFIGIVMLASSLVLSGILIYFLSKKRSKLSGRMSSNL